jgi:hypothetical protein
MSSAPTEHYGALAILLTVAVLLYHYNEDGLGWPAVTCYIDNEEIVNRSNSPYPKFCNVQQYLVHDYDLWLLTSHLLSSIKLHVEFELVRGHQTADDHNENIMATLLNIKVDKMATEQYNKCKSIPHRGAFHSGKVCYHQKGFHVQKIQNAIMARESDANLLTYYKQHGWSENALELVDWRQIEKFLRRRHLIERCNIIQLMHDWQHTGYQQMKFESRQGTPASSDSHSCPTIQSLETTGQCIFECGSIEKPFHYMQCRSELLSTARAKGRERIEKDLYDMQTALLL